MNLSAAFSVTLSAAPLAVGRSWPRTQQRPSSVHRTQAEAIDRARELARSQKAELIVHGKDGKIRARDSYGNDPFPPRG